MNQKENSINLYKRSLESSYAQSPTLVLDMLGSRLRVEGIGRDGLRLETNKPGPRGIPVTIWEQSKVSATTILHFPSVLHNFI